MDHLKIWGEELRLSSDDIDNNEIKQEEESDLVDEGEEDIEVDVTNEFFTDMVFNSRQSLIEWVQNTGRNLGFLIVTKRVKGMKLKTDDDWIVRVVCGVHNHSAALYMEGHSYFGKLSTAEKEILVDMSKNLVKSQNIFNDETNQLEELFFAHPGSLELLRAFPHVLLMDATYKTNRFKMPLFEIVGVTSTNMTFCIGFVFLQSEKEDNYTWALNCLRSTMDE
ncbi:uncharacterized protein LOC119987917 [Tripterygium wilfordii]|uniref:uncharacterized protein LOC119987917 n=1 Tax=Tripterygium wilfordii TaxID=458696 RepID=UPI0018F7F6CE|nr:uncharacterized protein LOC119987917 [Tripterygium wilfordii]